MSVFKICVGWGMFAFGIGSCGAGPEVPDCGVGSEPECIRVGTTCVIPSDAPVYGVINDAILTQYFTDYSGAVGCPAVTFAPCMDSSYAVWAISPVQPYDEEVAWVVVVDAVTLEWVGEVVPRVGNQQCSDWYRGDPVGLRCADEGKSRVSAMFGCDNTSQCDDVCECVTNTLTTHLPPECDEEV